MIDLTIKNVLEFYDVPQLFVATDVLGINYLCTLYASTDGYDYLGVQLSDLKLSAFLSGELDLRKAYLSPEREDSLYHVKVKDQKITADRMLQPSDVTEQMLPEAGFYYDTDDAIKDSNTDSMQIDIPVKDRSFFANMASRMGWTAKTLNQASRRIAIL